MRLLTTHWTLDSRESRAEREYITIVISIVDTNFPQAPACLFSSFDTHTTPHKESEQALRKSLWVAQVCTCFGLRWTFDSTYFAFNKLLPSIKLASALLRISKTDAHKDCIWTCRDVTRFYHLPIPLVTAQLWVIMTGTWRQLAWSLPRARGLHDSVITPDTLQLQWRVLIANREKIIT